MQKSDAKAFINQLLAYTLGMLVFTGSIGLGTVWLRYEISLVANRNQRLQARCAEVQRQIDEYKAEISAAQGADNLIRLDSALRLGLDTPRQEQIEQGPVNVDQWLAGQRSPELFTAEIQPVVYRRGGLR
jgi:hypothetical protein